MSGHSKWSSIKRKKGAADAKRGKVFSKLIKEISVAARMGGGDPNGNPRLRRVVDEARNINMPLDNITRAIKRGTGEIEGVSYEEMVYEGYGPGGVAILIEILTDNKNRTAAEIRKIFQKRSGNLGSAGCVAWMFERKGVIVVTKNAAPSERVMDLAIEAGAEDIEEDDNSLTIKTDQKTFDAVKKGLDDQKIRYDLASLSMEPQNTVKLSGKDADQMLHLMEELEDHEDVQKVYANFDISEEEMERVALQGAA